MEENQKTFNNEADALIEFQKRNSPAVIVVDNRSSIYYVENGDGGIIRNFEFIFKQK